MILSDKRILEEIEKGTIKIVPYDRSDLGSNSYDVHLGAHLAEITSIDEGNNDNIINAPHLLNIIKLKVHFYFK